MAGYTRGTSYRDETELCCSFSQFPAALGLRPGLREVLHRKKSRHSPYIDVGTAGEFVVLSLLRRLDPRWNHAFPATPAYLPRDKRGLPCGQYCGCADLFLDDPAEPAVGEAKFFCTREMPLGEEVPVDFRCQLEPEMRSNFVYCSYLVALRLPEVPSMDLLKHLRERAHRGEPLVVPGAELRVWEYRRDPKFWEEFVLPGLSRFEEWQRHARRDTEFCPTKRKNHRCFDAAYRTPDEQRARALECVTPGKSRLVFVHHLYAASPLSGMQLYCDTNEGREEEVPDGPEAEEVRQERLSWNQAADAGCERLVRLLGLD